MRVFEYLIKTPDNQVIDQILESSNTQNNLFYNVISLFPSDYSTCPYPAHKYCPLLYF